MIELMILQIYDLYFIKIKNNYKELKYVYIINFFNNISFLYLIYQIKW